MDLGSFLLFLILILRVLGISLGAKVKNLVVRENIMIFDKWNFFFLYIKEKFNIIIFFVLFLFSFFFKKKNNI
jgi:hypothetical protein